VERQVVPDGDGAVYHTQGRRSLYTAVLTTGFDVQPYVAPICRLAVSASIIHVWITTHLPTPEGWKAKLAYLANPQWTAYPPVNYRLDAGQRNSAVQRLNKD